MTVTKKEVQNIFDKSRTIRNSQLERELCDTFSVDKPKCLFIRKENVSDVPVSNLDSLRDIAKLNEESKSNVIEIEVTFSDTSSTEDAVEVVEAIRNLIEVEVEPSDTSSTEDVVEVDKAIKDKK